MQSVVVALALVTPQFDVKLHRPAAAPPRAVVPQALLPKAIIPFLFIPTYVQIGYAVEAKFRDGKGPFTRLIKSDFVQKSGGQMRRMKPEAPKVRGVRPTADVLAVTATFKREYDAQSLAFLWGALLKVYGDKERALAAVQINPQIMNPAYTFPNTVLESKRVLRSMMSEEESLDVMSRNPAVLQCGPSLELFGTDEIQLIANLRSWGNALFPPALRGPAVGALVAAVLLTVFASVTDSEELTRLVELIKPLLGGALGAIFVVAAYGAAQIGRKPVEGR